MGEVGLRNAEGKIEIEVLYGAPGAGKSIALRDEALGVPGLYLFCLPTIPLIKEQAKTYRELRPDPRIEIIEARSGEGGGRSKVQRQLDEARAKFTADGTSCRHLLETLRWVPSNPTKRYPKLGIVQAAEMAKRKKLTSTLNPATINACLNRLSSVLNFAMNEGLIDRNPTRGLKVADPVRARDKRLPSSQQQIQLIFNAPLYRGCLNDEAGYATPGPNRPRRGRFWVPLIGLFSGMRLNEICQLDVADIQEIEGVLCFHVRPDPSTKCEKRLKTEASERLVPIHPSLLNMGFTAYVEIQRTRGGVKLFPELRRSTTGYYSDPFSKWFRRFLRAAGADAPRTCFHSFRHSFRDALREKHVDHEVALVLGGWASGSGNDGSKTSANYGRGYRSATLRTAIEMVRFGDLDLRHLMPPSAR